MKDLIFNYSALNNKSRRSGKNNRLRTKCAYLFFLSFYIKNIKAFYMNQFRCIKNTQHITALGILY